MKITEVNTYTVRPRWGFVEIVTDEGLTGWGEPVLEGHCATVLACVQEMKPYLIGQDPMRIEDFPPCCTVPGSTGAAACS